MFYSSLGHNEYVYWNPEILKFYLAGLQYALGDLDADATPSKPGSPRRRRGEPRGRKVIGSFQPSFTQGGHWPPRLATTGRRQPMPALRRFFSGAAVPGIMPNAFPVLDP